MRLVYWGKMWLLYELNQEVAVVNHEITAVKQDMAEMKHEIEIKTRLWRVKERNNQLYEQYEDRL